MDPTSSCSPSTVKFCHLTPLLKPTVILNLIAKLAQLFDVWQFEKVKQFYPILNINQCLQFSILELPSYLPQTGPDAAARVLVGKWYHITLIPAN